MEALVDQGVYSDQVIKACGVYFNSHRRILCKISEQFDAEKVTILSNIDRSVFRKIFRWLYSSTDYPNFTTIGQIFETYMFCKKHKFTGKHADIAYIALNNIYKIQFESIKNGIVIESPRGIPKNLTFVPLTKTITGCFVQADTPTPDAIYITFDNYDAFMCDVTCQKNENLRVSFDNLIIGAGGAIIASPYEVRNYYNVPKMVNIVPHLHMPPYESPDNVVKKILGDYSYKYTLSDNFRDVLITEKVIHKLII